MEINQIPGDIERGYILHVYLFQLSEKKITWWLSLCVSLF